MDIGTIIIIHQYLKLWYSETFFPLFVKLGVLQQRGGPPPPWIRPFQNF